MKLYIVTNVLNVHIDDYLCRLEMWFSTVQMLNPNSSLKTNSSLAKQIHGTKTQSLWYHRIAVFELTSNNRNYHFWIHWRSIHQVTVIIPVGCSAEIRKVYYLQFTYNCHEEAMDRIITDKLAT